MKKIFKQINEIAKIMQQNTIKKDIVFDKNMRLLNQVKSSDKVMEILKPLISNAGIIVSSTVDTMATNVLTDKYANQHLISSIAVKYEFIADDGSSVYIAGLGDGKGNDASSCAYTMAFKNACIQLFSIHFENMEKEELERSLAEASKNQGKSTPLPVTRKPAPAVATAVATAVAPTPTVATLAPVPAPAPRETGLKSLAECPAPAPATKDEIMQHLEDAKTYQALLDVYKTIPGPSDLQEQAIVFCRGKKQQMGW